MIEKQIFGQKEIKKITAEKTNNVNEKHKKAVSYPRVLRASVKIDENDSNVRKCGFD